MPFYAQREGLPDTHSMWADPGSQMERVLRQIGHVEVPAPGAGPVEPGTAVDEPPVTVDDDAHEQPVDVPAPASRTRRR